MPKPDNYVPRNAPKTGHYVDNETYVKKVYDQQYLPTEPDTGSCPSGVSVERFQRKDK